MRSNNYTQVRFPSLSIRILRDVLEEAGLDSMRAFRSAGIDPATADEAGSVVTGSQELAFQKKFAELTRGRPELWVQAGRRYSFATFGVHGLAVATSPTLQDWVAVTGLMELNYSLADYSALEDADGHVVGLRFVYDGLDAELVGFSVHRDVVAILRCVSALTGQAVPPLTRVRLPVSEVSEEIIAMSPVPIELSAPEGTLEWSRETATHLLPMGDPFQHATYVREAQALLRRFGLEEDWPRQVINAMTASGEFGAGLGEIASALHVSPRTLQRKLSAEGHSFRDLRDTARFESAARLLVTTNLSIGEISHRVGYEGSANFTVAFRRWSGLSPSAYRASPSAADPAAGLFAR